MSQTVFLYAGETPLGILDNQLVAFLIPPLRAQEWIITPVPQHGDDAVIIETADHTAGLLLLDEKTGTPVAVGPLIAGRSEPPTFPPNEVWIRTPVPESDAPALAANGTAFTLRPQSASDQFIGRNTIEDLSMRPKRIVLRPPRAEPTPFVALPNTPPATGEPGETPTKRR